MIARFAEWQGREPASVAADAPYGNGEFLQWLMERGITPYMRTRDSALRKNNPLYGPDRFTYLLESNSYRCPAGQQLKYGGHNARNRTYIYIGTRKRCGACSQKAECTRAPLKYLAIHMHEPARQRARDLVNTPSFANAQRERKKVEALFAELNNQIGLRRLRLRRLKTEIKVCSRAVLPGCGGPEHQATGPLPQPRAKATARRDDLVSNPRKKLFLTAELTSHQLPLPSDPFSTATGVGVEKLAFRPKQPNWGIENV